MPEQLTFTTPAGEQLHQELVPNNWGDVTLAQYIQLLSTPSTPAVFVLTSITAELLGKLQATEASYLVNCLAFREDDSVLTEALPSKDLVNIGSATYGELLAVQQFMERHPDQPSIFYAPWIYAVYESEKRFREKNSPEKMQQLYQDMLALPVTEAYADVVFMLGAWMRFTSATPPPPRTSASPTTTKSTPGLKSWVRGSGSSLPWTRWLAATRSNTTAS